MALGLLEIYSHGTPQLWLQDDLLLHPYAHIMAVLIMSGKLVYNLDLPGETAACRDWQAWARTALRRASGPAQYPLFSYEVSCKCKPATCGRHAVL